ncbi:hypothetical protein PV327_010118 [Microctonus hyperodae]|uniref:Uncharacterized protein n=1 Tax=Microctonus hyperodae TaxID=165561 RepID=A0AA39FS28_MICHY|nr:hypothetical protein PV327_010118 [Microctonus hyperodae]
MAVIQGYQYTLRPKKLVTKCNEILLTSLQNVASCDENVENETPGSQHLCDKSGSETTECVADDNDNAMLILLSDNEIDIGTINLSQSVSSVLPADNDSDVTIFSDDDERQPPRPTSSNGIDSDESIIFEGRFPKKNMQTSTNRSENNSSPSLLEPYGL